SFDQIVGVMPERDLAPPLLLRKTIENAAPQTRAERALRRPGSLVLVDEIADARVFDVIGNAERLEVLLHHRPAQPLVALIDGDGDESEPDRCALLKPEEDLQEGEGVLPAGDRDGDTIPLLDHPVFDDRAADLLRNLNSQGLHRRSILHEA